MKLIAALEANVDNLDSDLDIDDNNDSEDFTQAKELNEANDRLMDTYQALEQLEVLIKKENISLESLQVMSALSVAGTNLPKDYFLGSNITLEDIANKKGSIIKQFFYNLSTSFGKILDYAQFNLTIINLQKKRLDGLKRKLSNMDRDTKKSVKVSNSKYTHYGIDKKRVEDIEEYIKKFDEVANVMTVFNDKMAYLASNDLFTTYDFLKKLATFKQVEYVQDRLNVIVDTVEDIVSKGRLKKEKEGGSYQIYASDVLLGLSQVVVHKVPKNTIVDGDITSMYNAMRSSYIYVDRLDKVRLSSLFEASSSYDIDHKQILQLIDLADSLLHSANKYLTASVKFSNRFANGKLGSAGILSYRQSDESIDEYVAFTVGGKVLNRISGIIYDSVASSYNFSIGNVKKALSIVENYVKK